MNSTISAIPTPVAVMLSGARIWRQKAGFALEAGWCPSGGVPVQSSSSQLLMTLGFPA
jgi:hypothetical protein